jgi:hypothetical protein
MLALICFILAIICWGLGALNVTWTTGAPATTHAPNWLCAGLFFAGLALWLAPLAH